MSWNVCSSVLLRIQSLCQLDSDFTTAHPPGPNGQTHRVVFATIVLLLVNTLSQLSFDGRQVLMGRKSVSG
eukprot:m.26581 g.26581  ORF g.26581 m.26581 type:complete len:71 (-) comp8846_c1_seq2:259-471(-)